MKPHVTATIWKDEGTLCFSVEAKSVCVTRREDNVEAKGVCVTRRADNHMINGTKLLDVAGMTRDRRDGILESEGIIDVVNAGQCA